MMMNTVYPGKRVSLGGNVSLSQVFDGYFGIFSLNQIDFPGNRGNVCEASGFFLTFPIIAAAMSMWGSRLRQHALLLFLLAYCVLILLWITVGFPSSIATFLGISLSQPRRTIIGLGIASIVLTVVFLSRMKEKPISSRNFGFHLMIGFGIFILLGLYGWHLQSIAPNFYRINRIFIVAVVGGAMAFFIFRSRSGR